jgi:sugar/nucleoside kinase (ribokinase family)
MVGASREGVVTGGTWCADHNKLVDIWPSEDQLAEILSEEWQGGGPGCNLAVDIKHLDPTMFVETIGLVGDDEDGRRLVAEADTNGIVRTQLHVTTDAPTNYTDAYSSQLTGRRTHIFYAGTSALLSHDHFDFERTRARLLHLGLPGIHRLMDGSWNGDENGWVTVLKRARAAGLLTNMELVSARADLIARTVRPCLPHLDYLIVNDVEIGAVAGVPTTSVGETDLSACAAAPSIRARPAVHCWGSIDCSSC